MPFSLLPWPSPCFRGLLILTPSTPPASNCPTEIVDESDVVVDNVSKRRVDDDLAAHQRRLAFNTMLDPRELHDPSLDAIEIAAVASFLAANVEAFSPLLISAATLQQLLDQSVVRVASGDEPPPFQKGRGCDACTVVLQGRLHVVCGSEEFESDRGPWTVLGAPSLRQNPYIADFTAKVMEPSRLLQIARVDYESALKREAESLAAAVRAAVYEQSEQLLRQRAEGINGGPSPRSPYGRVACTIAPELAAQYSDMTAVTAAAAVGVARDRIANQEQVSMGGSMGSLYAAFSPTAAPPSGSSADDGDDDSGRYGSGGYGSGERRGSGGCGSGGYGSGESGAYLDDVRLRRGGSSRSLGGIGRSVSHEEGFDARQPKRGESSGAVAAADGSVPLPSAYLSAKAWSHPSAGKKKGRGGSGDSGRFRRLSDEGETELG